MEKNLDVNYGVQSIRFGSPLPNGAFAPIQSETDVHKITHIVIDSVVPEQEDDTTNDVRCEEFDPVFLVLTSEKGKKTIVFRSYNYSEEVYTTFLGYEKQADGSLIEIPNYVIPPFYMEIETRSIGQFKGKIMQYTPCKVSAKETGTLGKNGLAEIEFKVEVLANIDNNGVLLGSKKISAIPPTA